MAKTTTLGKTESIKSSKPDFASKSLASEARKKLTQEQQKQLDDKFLFSIKNTDPIDWGKSERLLDLGADIEVKSNGNNTVLMHVVFFRDADLCRKILDRLEKEDVNIKSYIDATNRNSGKNALMEAAQHGRTEMCIMLIGRGANIDLRVASDIKNAFNGMDALEIAQNEGHEEMVKKLAPYFLLGGVFSSFQEKFSECMKK